MQGYQQAPGVHEPKGMRKWGYQQIPGVHEPKDEDVRIRSYQQAHRIHEPKYRIRGCKNMRL